MADHDDRTTGMRRADLQLDDLYREVVLDHYRRPRGRQPLSHPSRSVEGFNPSCGDQIHLALTVEGDQVKEIQVECHGCSISVASGSMMAEMVPGHDVAEVRRLIQAVRGMMERARSGLGSRRRRGTGGGTEVPRACEVRAPGVDHAGRSAPGNPGKGLRRKED